jgi:NADH:ubiquinone oxidoreductase subunit K
MDVVTSSLPEQTQCSTLGHLFLLSGISLAAGGFITTAAWIVHAIVDPGRSGYAEPWWLPLNLALSFGAILMAMGLPGFHARHASKAGIPGLIGLVLLFSGMLLAYVGVQTLEAFSRPQIPATFGVIVGIAGPTFFLGIVVTSVVTWRAGVYPRAISAALGMAAILALLTRPVALPDWLALIVSALFTAVMAWMGITLVRASMEDRSSIPSAAGTRWGQR